MMQTYTFHPRSYAAGDCQGHCEPLRALADVYIPVPRNGGAVGHYGGAKYDGRVSRAGFLHIGDHHQHIYDFGSWDTIRGVGAGVLHLIIWTSASQ
jgi:hypothetical protein